MQRSVGQLLRQRRPFDLVYHQERAFGGVAAVVNLHHVVVAQVPPLPLDRLVLPRRTAIVQHQ